MARSTRSATRDLSPPKQPGRATRATRSQSVELDKDDAAKPGRQTRSSRQASVEITTTKSNKRRKGTRAPQIAQDLSMVEEDDAEEEEGDPRGKKSKPSKSMPTIGEAPHLPGNTARDMDSDDLSVDLIIPALAPLDEFSSNIINQLTRGDVNDIRKLLEDPKSKLSKRVKDLVAHLEISKANFGNGVFIDNDLVLQKLFGYTEPELDGEGRPDHILYKANIAVTMYKLLSKKGGDPGLTEIMTELDDNFPTPFLPVDIMEDENDNIREAVSEIALNIRTQLTCLHLRHHQGRDNFDPDDIIAQMFYHGSEDMTVEQILEKMQLKTIAGLTRSATEDLRDRIDQVIDNIRQVILDDDHAHKTKEYVDLEELRNRFPWEDFLVEVFNLLQHRADECQNHIDRQGGVRKMAQILGEGQDHEITLNFDEPSTEPASEATPADNAGIETKAQKARRIRAGVDVLFRKAPTRSSPRFSSKGGISGSEQTIIAGPSKPRSVIRETPFSEAAEETAHADDGAADVGADDVGADDFDGRADESVAPDIPNLLSRYQGADDFDGRADESVVPDFQNLLSTLQGVEKEKNKENNKPKGRSKYSRPDARKAREIPADEEEEDPAPNVTSKSRPKRSNEAANVEEEEDNLFVSEQQSTNPRSPKKARTQPASSSHPRTNSENQRNARGNSRAGEDDQEEEANEAPVPSQGYREVNVKAKRQVAMNKSVKNQSRVPWTVAECEALVELIGDYGNGYAAISKSEEAREAIQERHREQVALKDKARNIKMDYLLAGSPLPKNFDQVKLGQKERDRIIKAGLNPFRQEGEEVGAESLDENGEPYE